MTRQLPGDPDPLEVEPEPVRRDRRQTPESDLGLFAIIGAILVILGIVALCSIIAFNP